MNNTLLTKNEERELGLAIKAGKMGDSSPASKRLARKASQARNTLIESNLQWVKKVAKEFQGRGVDLEDLIQAGNLGLIAAVDAYDPEKGRFLTFARWYVKGEIKRELEQNSSAIRIPAEKYQAVTKLAAVEARLTSELGGSTPSPAQLAIELGLEADEVSELGKLLAVSIDSLDAEDENGITLSDRIANGDDGYAIVDLDMSYEVLLTNLNDEERAAFILRYGLQGYSEHSYAEIGAKLFPDAVPATAKSKGERAFRSGLSKLHHPTLSVLLSAA